MWRIINYMRRAAVYLAVLAVTTCLFSQNVFAAVGFEPDVGPNVTVNEDGVISGRWSARARVVLTSYTITDSESLDNGALTLRLKLTNTSEYEKAYSVLVTYEDEKGRFLPAYGNSNQFFFAAIAPRETVEQEITLVAANITGVIEEFALSFKVEYVDYVFGRTENNFRIGGFPKRIFKALQDVGLETTGAPSGDGYTPIRITGLNSADFPLYNVHVLVKRAQDQTGSVQRFAIGDIAANARIDQELRLLIPDSRVQQMLISFEYEDGDAMQYTTSSDLVTIYRYQSNANTAQTGAQRYIPAFAVHIVLIAVVIGLLLRMQRKGRRA